MCRVQVLRGGCNRLGGIMFDLKVTLKNVLQLSLIQGLVLYKFKQNHNETEATKNICFSKDEGPVDHNAVTRGFKKFRLGCKNLNDLARSGRSKCIDSKAVFQVIKTNPMNSTGRVSGELGI